MSLKIYDARTGKPVATQPEKTVWVPNWSANGKNVYKWQLTFRTVLSNGDEIGGTHTDIFVYASGSIDWPGKPAMMFDTPDEAKQFVEATYALEESIDDSAP